MIVSTCSHCSHRPMLVPSKLPGFEYQIDPYVGREHYCYYCYVLGQAETDWSREILMYEDIRDLPRAPTGTGG